MESLLCNEVWLNVEENDRDFAISLEDCEEAFAVFVAKETRYLPQPGYLKLIQIDDLIGDARFKAVSWIIKSQTRMNLCAETVFGAVNYLDRFISLSQCQGWKCWMFEVLSIACLSIATKFNETSAYLLHEFQEDLEVSFAPSLIQRMEMTVLKRLDWRVDSITPFSYIYLLTQTTDASQQLTERVTELLFHVLLDPKFLEFQQSVVAISAVRTVFQDLLPSGEYASSFAHIDTLFSQDRKNDLIHCERLMRKVECPDCCSSPSSPVTVLKVNLLNSYAVFSLKMTVDLRSSRKRKREEGEEGL